MWFEVVRHVFKNQVKFFEIDLLIRQCVPASKFSMPVSLDSIKSLELFWFVLFFSVFVVGGLHYRENILYLPGKHIHTRRSIGMFRLIDCRMFYVPLDKISLSWRRQHFRRRTAKCLPVHEKLKGRKVMST